MNRPKKTRTSVRGLVAAGVVAIFMGMLMMIKPIPYISSGGVNRHAKGNVTSVFTSKDCVYIGGLISLAGGFILLVAYRVKKS